jgi:hypothetical protein
MSPSFAGALYSFLKLLSAVYPRIGVFSCSGKLERCKIKTYMFDKV